MPFLRQAEGVVSVKFPAVWTSSLHRAFYATCKAGLNFSSTHLLAPQCLADLQGHKGETRLGT